MKKETQIVKHTLGLAVAFVACLATEGKVSAAGAGTVSCQQDKGHLVCKGTPFSADIHASNASIAAEDFSPPWWKGAHATPSYSFSQSATPAETLSPKQTACGKQQLAELANAVRGESFSSVLSSTVVQIDVNDYEGASPLLLVNSDGAQNYKPARSLASSIAPAEVTITGEQIYLRANTGGGEGCDVVSSTDIKTALEKLSASAKPQNDKTVAANGE